MAPCSFSNDEKAFFAQKLHQSPQQDESLKAGQIELIKEQIGGEMGKMKSGRGHGEVAAAKMGNRGGKLRRGDGGCKESKPRFQNTINR